jgi:plastocyanin
LGILVFVSLCSFAKAANHVVTMLNFTFSPRDLVVNIGDSITWSNRDFVLHDAVSGTNGAPNGIWNSGLLSRNGSFTFTFNSPGGYGYYCTPHYASRGMIGTVTVLPPPNNGPSVAIVSPIDGQNFSAGTNIFVEAAASDADGIVQRVEFFTNGVSIGAVVGPSFTLVLSNVPPGAYALTATATDDSGATGSSAAVSFSVAGVPMISLVSPTNAARFILGTSVPIVASVSVPEGVGLVEFFANGQVIAQLTQAPFEFEFKPSEEKDFLLFARVVDVLGQTVVSSNVLIRVFATDTNPPTVAITNAPRNFSRLDVAQIVICGKAADNQRVDYVELQINDGQFQRTTGTTNWSAQIDLPAGNNVVRVRSVDFAGNVSTTATRFLTFVLKMPLMVESAGQGDLAPDLDGRQLQVGLLYSITAKPAAGFIFSNWLANSVMISTRPVLGFRMESNLTLVANFVRTPFTAATYAGIFTNNSPGLENSGLVRLRLRPSGKFTGRIQLDHKLFSFRGHFDASGHASVAILRRGRSPVAIDFILDLTNELAELTGTVTSAEWTSQLFAERVPTRFEINILSAEKELVLP